MASPSKSSSSSSTEDGTELRRGPWTDEEDALLIRYIACHGEGRWNLLAKCSGLRRTGKSCRLRWLNYLKPDVKRGNLSPEEQLLILELHSKWGNRWSKIAQFLPGRTDNEIKNYWRTKVQKQARNMKIDSNSPAFQQLIRWFWMPRLIQKIEAGSIQESQVIHNTQSPIAALPQQQQDYCHQTLINPCSLENNLNSPESMKLDHQDDVVKVSELFPRNGDDQHEFDSSINGHEHYQFGPAMEGFSPSPFSAITAEFKDEIEYDKLGGENNLMDDFLDDSLWSMDKF